MLGKALVLLQTSAFLVLSFYVRWRLASALFAFSLVTAKGAHVARGGIALGLVRNLIGQVLQNHTAKPVQ